MNAIDVRLLAGMWLFLVLIVPVPARSAESRSLLRIPTPEVLPNGGLSLLGGERAFFNYKNDAGGLSRSDAMVSGGIGVLGFAQIGFSLNTFIPVKQSGSADVRVRLLKEGTLLPAVAVGCMDITGNKHRIEQDEMPVTGSDYRSHPENNSFYVVMRKGLLGLVRVYAGIGTGRFVGRGPTNEKLHGAFGGGELELPGPFVGLAEIDGRNANAGLGASFAAYKAGDGTTLDLNASVWCLYLQNLRSSSLDVGLRPALKGRLELVLGLPVGEKPGKDLAGAEQVEIRPRVIEFSRPVRDWTIEVRNPEGRLVRTISGAGLPPKELVWDGLDDRGAVVPAGKTARLSLKVRDIDGKELSAVVPSTPPPPPFVSSAEKSARSRYRTALAELEAGQTLAGEGHLREVAGAKIPGGKTVLVQVRACEVLALRERQRGNPGASRLWSQKADALAEGGKFGNNYRTRKGENLWNLSGNYLGDYRLGSLIYEANLERLKSPGNIPAGIVLRMPKDVLEEDYPRAITIFLEASPPQGFSPD